MMRTPCAGWIRGQKRGKESVKGVLLATDPHGDDDERLAVSTKEGNFSKISKVRNSKGVDEEGEKCVVIFDGKSVR